MKITPSQRTTSWLKEAGYTCGTVERHIHPSSFTQSHGYTRDLFGCIDVIAVRPDEVLAVQSTGTDWSGHWKKLTEGDGLPGTRLWLATGSPFLLIGWRKIKSGWFPRIHYFTPQDLITPIKPASMRSYEDWTRRVERVDLTDTLMGYGYCPHCGSPGESRERRPGGNDRCRNGHEYPSSTAKPFRTS